LGDKPITPGPIEIPHSHLDLSSTKEGASLFITTEQARHFFDDLASG
jgi:hypothetical protein